MAVYLSLLCIFLNNVTMYIVIMSIDMHAHPHVQRTTRGVWVDLSSTTTTTTSSSSSSAFTATSSSSSSSSLSSSTSPPPLIVLDTEGLESTARGQGGDGSRLFDRQISALAVTAADVILLNVWARDVRGGRIDGASESALHVELMRTLVKKQALNKPSSVEKDKTEKGRRALVVVLRDSEHPEGDVAVAKELIRQAIEEAKAQIGALQDEEDKKGSRIAPPPGKGRQQQQQQRQRQAEKKKEGEEEEERESNPTLIMEEGIYVTFIALPSRTFQPEAFAVAVARLQETLLGAEARRYKEVSSSLFSHLFSDTRREKMQSDSKKGPAGGTSSLQPVPLPQFPSFAQELWQSIIAESGGIIGGEGEGQGRKEEEGQQQEEEDKIRSFIRRKVVESCCQEAEKVCTYLHDRSLL